MYNTFNEQTLAFGQRVIDITTKAQDATFKSLEQIGSLHTRALHDQLDAHKQFAAEAGTANDLESLRALWTRSAEFGRERAEKAVATQQDVLTVMAKNAQLMADLGREQFDLGSEAVAAAPKATKKAK